MSATSPTTGAATIYAWDFFGPNAEGTAQHFLRHLEQYRAKLGLEGCETGLESERAGHHAVWCRTPPAADAAILQLRPKRRRAASG